MGTLDAVLAETGSQFGIDTTKASSLLSGLLGLITQTPGGLSGFLDRFRSAGLGDVVSSWMGGSNPRPISGTALETALGRPAIDGIASKAGLAYSTASSALAFLLPNLVQRLAPGGVIPTHLPSDILAYAGSATSAVAAGARSAVQATERVVQKAGAPSWMWPLLAVLAVLLIGLWMWNSRQGVKNAAFNAEDAIRMAGEKASSALAALKPGYTARDLVSALNLNIINFPTGSAQIPPDQTAFLNKAAIAMKGTPSMTVIEIDGHTDNTGDAASNMALSQQRADAVRVYLIQQGADGNMIVAKGFGDTMPIASNDTEEGKFRNRRIEFVVK
jgi:outer membrane protein OmpA-like peptidoglycan-associated protein/uncharacterized protein YidB (DUF937 family)